MPRAVVVQEVTGVVHRFADPDEQVSPHSSSPALANSGVRG